MNGSVLRRRYRVGRKPMLITHGRHRSPMRAWPAYTPGVGMSSFSGSRFAVGNPNSYVITVQWTEPGSDGALSYTLTVES